MEIFDNGDGLDYYLEYSTHLFREDSIIRISGYFEHLIGQVIQAPTIALSGLLLITPGEYEKYIWTINKTEAVFPRDKTSHRLFEEEVMRTPDHIAVEFGDRAISYRELNRRADGLSFLLRERGIGPNTIVGLLCRRSPEMIVGLLGILKAG